MKVLMINSNLSIMPLPVFPYGLCMVSASLEKAGHKIYLLDLCFLKNVKQGIENTIKAFNPDIIGVTVRNIDAAARLNAFFQLEQVKSKVIDPLKQVFSGPIIIGGPAVGISGAEILEYFDLEYAIIGDGEAAMVDFVQRIENTKSLKGLKGLTRRKDGKIIEENEPWRITELNDLPLPDYRKYLELETYRRYKSTIQIQSKRGCALNCTYCTYKIIEGQKIRLRDPQLVADEIEKIYKETGFEYFEFTDSAFNVPLGHSKAVLRAIIAKKLNIKMRTMGLVPSAIDEEYVDLLKQAHFEEVELGIESGNDEMLQALGKNFNSKAIFRAAELLGNVNIPAKWYLILGAPGETMDTLKETFETVKKAISPWDFIVVFNGIRTYKGAAISEQFKKEKPHCTDDNFLRPVFYEPKSISLDDISTVSYRMMLKYLPNVVIPERRQNISNIVLKIQNLIIRLFCPQLPWWKFYIFTNKVKKILGINFMKRKILEFKNPQLFKEIK
ncbi:MAG: radical SAM protein [Candidatus Aminicenantes bacterium]|nr:radical SAM protein [Candidatus Aminicenantes bacterium]